MKKEKYLETYQAPKIELLELENAFASDDCEDCGTIGEPSFFE